MSNQLTAGIILGCASAASANAGVVIEKLAMRRMPAFEASNTLGMVRRLLRSPVWVLGFSMIAAGLVIQVMALSLASISVVQAVAPAGTVLLLVLSHIVLGDRLRRMEYLGIGALVAAFVLLLCSVNSNSDRATGSAQLVALLAITLPTICLSLFCFVSANQGSRHSTHRRRTARAPLNGLATGLLYGCAALDLKWLSTLVQRLGVGGAVPHILVSPVLYMFLVTSVLAFLMFQFALQRSVTSVLVPVSSLLSTAYFIVVGDALFHEHLPQAALSLSLRLASFVCLAFGLLSLAGVKQPIKSDERIDLSDIDAGSAIPAPAFDASPATPAPAFDAGSVTPAAAGSNS